MRDINPQGQYPGTPAHRSIRNIPVGGNHRHAEHPAPRQHRARRGRGRFWFFALIVAGVFGLCGALVSIAFAGATVNVYPKQMTVQAPPTLEARLITTVGGLEYKTVAATREASLSIKASGTQQVSRQASALVTIYNRFSTEPQRLIANTRFEAPGGKIYRIRESVTVPGMTSAGPGQASATVYADSPGASYNTQGAVTFTVPGFKGSPQYDKITATSQGAIAGGFVGTEPAASEADMQKARADLKKRLDDQGLVAINSSIPDGYGLLPGSLTMEYSDIGQRADGDQVVLLQEVTATGAIVRADDLASAIARATVAGYKGEAVSLTANNLNVTASSTGEGVLAISMQGTATLVWQFDPAKIRTALAGKNKSEFQTVLAGFAPAIECSEARPCDVRVRPFWASTFPTEADDIKVYNKAQN